MSESDIGYLGIFLRLFATLFFVLVNGFFVAAEFALVKVKKTSIEARVKKGQVSARTTQSILKNLDLYLASCQMGITVASLILGWLAEPAVAFLLIKAAKGMGVVVLADSMLHAVALVIALAFITVLHITLGEQAPKMLAIKHAEKTALRISYPLLMFTGIFRPFIWVVSSLSNGMLRMSGFHKGSEHDSRPTVEEFTALLASSVKSGLISGNQKEYAENVVKMIDLDVRHILIPRSDIVFLSVQDSLETNLQKMKESAHSRFPVCEMGLDTIIGIVHTKDVFARLIQDKNFNLKDLVRRPCFVPDTQSLSRFIYDMRLRLCHIAPVVDEHGNIIGFVFLEDAIEEIVGPIQDEFDHEYPMIEEMPDGSVEVAGQLPAPDAEEMFGIKDMGENDTIGGFITELLGRMPKKGDLLSIDTYDVIVLNVAKHRIRRLKFVSKDAEKLVEG